MVVVAAGPTDNRVVTLNNLLNIEQVSFLPLPPVDLRQGLVGALADRVLEGLVGREGRRGVFVYHDKLWGLP